MGVIDRHDHGPRGRHVQHGRRGRGGSQAGAREDGRALRLAATVAAVAVPACVLLSTVAGLGDWAEQAVDDGAQFAGAVFAAVCCWGTWRRSLQARRGPSSWLWRLLLAVGITGWACGQALWSWYQLVEGRPLPSPSLADVGYLTLPVFAVPAVLLLPAPSAPRAGAASEGAARGARGRLLLALDALVVVGSLFVLAWSTSLGAAVRGGAATTEAFAVAVAYPVTDLVMVVIVLLIAVFRRPRHRQVLALLGAGLVALAASDSSFLYLVSFSADDMPPLYDVGFIVGPVLIGLAALAPEPAARPVTRARQDREARWFVLLPYLPLAAIGLLVVVQQAAGLDVDRAEDTGLVVLAGVVVVRQLLTLLENLELLRRVREARERLEHQAFHDWLTGLPNRALFRERLEAAVGAHARGDRIAVLFLDLDDFKDVNDTFGHAAGDELLKATAQRLRRGLADGDTAARLGGDEFAVVLATTARTQEPAAVSERLVAALSRPVQLGGGTVVPRFSAGLVVLEPGEAAVTADLVLHQADVAMYTAKRSGKGYVVTYRGDGHAPSGDLATQLGCALQGTGDVPPVHVVYQPVVRLADEATVAVEALVRWDRAGLPVAPELLVQTAEAAGLARLLHERVLAQACSDVARLRSNGRGDLAVHVNVPPSLLTADLAASVAAALRAAGLSGQALVLEVTESGRVEDVPTASAALAAVRRLGVRVALDDFGTGYSNLTHLLGLPVDVLKLDRALAAGVVAEGTGAGRAAAVVGAAVRMARQLGLTVVAEGVEEPRQAALLAELGCDHAQGYLFSPPRPVAQLAALPPAARTAAGGRWAGGVRPVRAS
ncbi:MAG TPA: EAL domain-containing protein [Kineosporiaceae bacterium]|nr:EAL domain-containing protein [Kineosporiaceae bacterium]